MTPAMPASPVAASPATPEPPEPPRPRLGWRLILEMEAALRWLLAYPFYLAQIVVLMLAAWAGLGKELGVEQLFWNEDVWIQLGTGVAVGMLLGMILFVLYLLYPPTLLLRRLRRVRVPFDTGRLTRKWVRERRNRLLTLFPSDLWQVRLVGRYLLFGLVAMLVVLVAGKVIAALVLPTWDETRRYVQVRCYFVPFVCGYVLAMLFARALYWLDERGWTRLGFKTTIRQRLLQWRIWTPRGGWRTLDRRLEEKHVRQALRPLHGIATYLMVVTVVVFGGLVAMAIVLDAVDHGRSLTSPVTFVSLVFILLSLVYGALAFHLHAQRILAGGLVVLLLFWNSTEWFKENSYKLRFPGLDYEARTVLWRQGETENESLEKVLELTKPYADRELIAPHEPVEAMHERWREKHPGQKPKLIFICTSGGGIRAAVWTGVVLHGLENDKKLPHFRDNIRMITGASGGMVAATLYAADFENGPVADERYVNVLAADSLTRTAQSLVLRDMLVNTLVPPWQPATWDRGRTLEWKWGLNAEQYLGRNPFKKTFAELRELERDGLRPSLVLSPMMVEDSRRLLISNLNLTSLTYNEGPAHQADWAKTGKPNVQLSRSGVEFHRLFPDVPLAEARERFADENGRVVASSHTFQVGTAARMSATFPVISPAVSLPTDPPRRLVDAGLYDNYGVSLAARWIFENREVLKENTSGVALIQIRAFPLHRARNSFAAIDPTTGKLQEKVDTGDLFTDTLASVSAPLEAVLAARANIAYFRNAEATQTLHRVLNNPRRNGNGDADQQGPPKEAKVVEPKDKFFCNVWLELRRPAALNWYLTKRERQDVIDAFNDKNDEELQNQLAALREWYGTGGK
jgi:hypothetical protein